MNTLISDKNNQLLKAPNNFDFIRYFFAFSLVIVHFCTLMGIDQFWVISGGLRVKVFFIMSGFHEVERAKMLIKDISIELEILSLDHKIDNEIRDSLEKEQKEFFHLIY